MDKNTCTERTCFHLCFLVFAYPGETLALAVHILHTKFANFARLYLPHFTTFCNQSLQFHKFQDALFSCGNIFTSLCLDENSVYSCNYLFLTNNLSLKCQILWYYLGRGWNHGHLLKFGHIYHFFVSLPEEGGCASFGYQFVFW